MSSAPLRCVHVCVCVYLIMGRRGPEDIGQRITRLSPDHIHHQLLGAATGRFSHPNRQLASQLAC